MRQSVAPALICLAVLMSTSTVHAKIDQGTLNELARTTTDQFIHDTIGPRIQDNIPIVSSSSAFSFRFDNELGVWQRADRTTGSIFLERAEPIGAGKIEASVSYAYVKYENINGRDLSDELRTVDANGAVFTFRIHSAEAQLVNFGLTYGLTDSVDVSLVVPIERVYIASNFTIVETNGDESVSESDRRSNVGIGDIVLRGKWQAWTQEYAHVALGLELKVPSGDPDKALGLGDTRLTPSVYVSQIFARRFEPHLQLGIETDLAYIQKSRFVWGAGFDFELLSTRGPVLENFGLMLDLLGRTDLDAPSDRNSNSFFGTARQRNIMDIAPGFKLGFMHEIVMFVACQLPLNTDGLRAEFVPVGGIEAAF